MKILGFILQLSIRSLLDSVKLQATLFLRNQARIITRCIEYVIFNVTNSISNKNFKINTVMCSLNEYKISVFKYHNRIQPGYTLTQEYFVKLINTKQTRYKQYYNFKTLNLADSTQSTILQKKQFST